MKRLQETLNNKEAVSRKQEQELRHLHDQVRKLRLEQSSANLRKALEETQRKVNQEQQRADSLAKTVHAKEAQLRNLATSLNQRENRIADLVREMESKGDKAELERLKKMVGQREQELARLKAENEGLLQRVNRSRKELEAEVEAVRGAQYKQMELAAKQNQESIEKILSDKEKSTKRLLEMKDQQLRQMEENLEFFKKEAENFKKQVEDVKNGRNHKIEELEKELEEQNGQMGLMRRDLVHLEKLLQERDSLLKKTGARDSRGDSPEEFKMAFNWKRKGKFSGNEYSFGQNQPLNSKSNQFDPDPRAKNTLLSEGGAEMMRGNKQGALIQSKHLRNVPFEESELARESMVKELEHSNNNLRSKLATLADEKDSLEVEVKKLKRRLEDLQAEADDRNKWRRKALDAENRVGDMQAMLASEKKKRARLADDRAEEARKLGKQVEKLTSDIRSKETVISELKEQVRGSQGDLKDLLRNLKNGSGDSSQNKELLKEIVKKVDELFSKSNKITKATRETGSNSGSGQTGDNQNVQEGTSHANHPYFYNQPHYQLPGMGQASAENQDMYVKIIFDENAKLKKEIEILNEKFIKLRKNVGNKKKRILNEIASLIRTKNSFESRFVSEITQCPYKEVVIEKNISEKLFSQASYL